MLPSTAFHRVVPLHHQIERLLRAQIASGEWAPGERVPAEVELVQRFKVSRTTVRQALRALEREGLITRGRGLGTFVSAAAVSAPAATVRSQLFDYEAKVQVLDIRTLGAPKHVGEFLGVQRGQPVRRFLRLESVDKQPLAVLINYLPLALGKQVTRKDLARRSMLECLVARLSTPFGTVRQSIEARLPDDEVATLLGIDLMHPVLVGQSRMSDQAGQPVQLCDMFYRADRCRYESEMPFPPPDHRTRLEILRALPRGAARKPIPLKSKGVSTP